MSEYSQEFLEPGKAYDMLYKEQIKEAAAQFFDDLTVQSAINVDENHQFIEIMKNAASDKNIVTGKLRKKSALRTFLIIVIILLFAGAGVLSYFAVDGYWYVWADILILVAVIILAIMIIVYLSTSVRKDIKALQDQLNSQSKKEQEYKTKAQNNMIPLNQRFDWNMQNRVINSVIPLIELDDYMDIKKQLLLEKKYGLSQLLAENRSVLMVQSGSILGNPFIICKELVHEMYNKVYTGSRVVTYTTRIVDSEGHSRLVTRTQTLTASVTRPAAGYTRETSLIYGNAAAPNLSFSRKPQGMTDKSDKAIQRHVLAKEKELAKEAERSLLKGGHFTPLGNIEFEVLFHAWNRDHEQQFRLLFTPLAQTNMLKLIKETGNGFGDDFYFYKNKMINTISSKHSQSFNYDGNPYHYMHHDYEVAKQLFINYVSDYFRNFFFDLAPLMSIPLYQQMKTLEFIYGDDAPSNYSTYEHEVMANSFEFKTFDHEDSDTLSILKTRLLRKDGQSDKIEITSRSYHKEQRVTYVSVMANDGCYYDVPVYWDEYIPVSKVSEMEMKNTSSSKYHFDNLRDTVGSFLSKYGNGNTYTFQRGMFGFIPLPAYNGTADKDLSSAFKANDNK